MGSIGGQGWVGTWDASKFIKNVEQRTAKGVGKAAALLVRDAKFLVSRPGVKKTTPFGTTRVGGKEVPRGTEGGDITRVSRPGEPPRKRTGALQASIHMEQIDHEGLKYKVGSPLVYALALELGYMERNLKPRPYLRAALARMSSEMAAVMVSHAKGERYQEPKRGEYGSAELTDEDIARGRKNKFFKEPPAMGEK